MKKILFIEAPEEMLYGKAMKRSFRDLGYELQEPEYLGLPDGTTDKKLLEAQNKKYIAAAESFKPDVAFVVNNLNVEPMFLEYCQQYNIGLYMSCYDSIRWCGNAMECMQYYDDIFSYEPLDTKIEFKPGHFIKYMPLGYDRVLLKPLANRSYKYDLCFVGDLDPRRIELLDKVANWAAEHNKKLVVYTSRQLKKITSLRLAPKIFFRGLRFRMQHGNLYKAIINEPIFGEPLCELYNSTRICLNINVGKDPGMHTGTNPRTFEILGCQAFELLDEGHIANVDLKGGRDLVEFTDAQDLLQKIEYYLQRDEERQRIAKQGCKKVEEKYSCQVLVKQMTEMMDR